MISEKVALHPGGKCLHARSHHEILPTAVTSRTAAEQPALKQEGGGSLHPGHQTRRLEDQIPEEIQCLAFCCSSTHLHQLIEAGKERWSRKMLYLVIHGSVFLCKTQI